MMKRIQGITLISLIITIVILLILAGISISAITSDNGLFNRVKQAKQTQIETEIKESLNLAINDLQMEKAGNASIDDITQGWANSKLSEYNPKVKNTNDEEVQEKTIALTKSQVTKKYKINANLSIEEMDLSGVTLEYEIEISTPTVNTSNSTTVTTSVSENSIEKGTPLYINFNILTEGITYKIKYNDEEITMPYEVSKNGKYIFEIEGEYEGYKLVKKTLELTLKQYKGAVGVVAYDAGIWTQEEINELKRLKLYDYNETHTKNSTFKLKDESGLNFTFGGFKAGDSRNESIPSEIGTPKYDGWQILECKEENGKVYVSKIAHAGSPENFVSYYTTGYDSYRSEYILSRGLKQTSYNKLSDNVTIINPREYQMYIDKDKQNLIADIQDKEGNNVKDIHVMTQEEALKITGSTSTTTGIRKTDAIYWLETAKSTLGMWFVHLAGEMVPGHSECWYNFGIRPVVTLKEGVYIASGSGTDGDPYILAMK